MHGTNNNESITRTMNRHASHMCAATRITLAAGLAIGLAWSGTASAQSFQFINCPSKNYNEGRTNTAARSMVPFHGTRSDGSPVLGLWDVQNGVILENYDAPWIAAVGIESYGFAQTRGPGDPVKGIDIGLIKKPRPAAFAWNTEGDGDGTTHLLNDLGMGASWATALDSSGRVIGGAVYGSVGGAPDSPQAAVWYTFTGYTAAPTLLPTPAGTLASEVTGVSSDGLIQVGTISENHSSRPQPKAINEPRVQGIVWSPGGMTVVDPSVAGPDSVGLAFDGLAGDNDACFATISTTRSNLKGGLYRISTDSFTLLDGGDVNGDGLIDLMDDHDSLVAALSLDSSLAGGSIAVAGFETAMVWLNGSGGYEPMDAVAYLTGLGVSGLDGWHLSRITGISPDGLSLSGIGIAPAGYTTVWYASIPSPGALTLLGLGGLLATRRRR